VSGIGTGPQRAARPAGSMYADELMRYLTSVGLKQFHDINSKEAEQFACHTVNSVVRSYGPRDLDYDELFKLITGTERRVCITPFTAEAIDYAAWSDDFVVVLSRMKKGEEPIKNVKLLMRAAFVNKILADKRKERSEKKVRESLSQKNIPSARRRRTSGDIESSGDSAVDHSNGQSGYQSLLPYAEAVLQERTQAEIDEARFIVDKVSKKMSARQKKVVDLMLDGYRPVEIAGEVGMSVAGVNRIIYLFRSRCKKERDRLNPRRRD